MFRQLMDLTGINPFSAHTFLGVTRTKFEGMNSGYDRNTKTAERELAALYRRMHAAVEAEVAAIQTSSEPPPAMLYFKPLTDDHAARRHGWPSRSVYDRVCAMIAARVGLAAEFRHLEGRIIEPVKASRKVAA